MLNRQLISQINKIPGWLSENEGMLLFDWAKRAGGKGAVVEIGSFQGKSTIYTALALKEIGAPAMFAIDPHLGITHAGKKEHQQTFSNLKKNIRKFGLTSYITMIRTTSANAAGDWKKKISFLNIDGLHEYKFVKQDLQVWLPHLKPGGVVICHDAFSPEPDVFRAIKEEIFDGDGFKLVGISDSQIFAVKGKPSSTWEKLNLGRSKFFITLALRVLQNRKLPWPLRKIVVNRILKISFINRFMFQQLMDKRLRGFLVFSLLVLLFLLTRLYHLTILPMFFDEEYFILWAKRIATTNAHWFISLSGQKNVLLIWIIQFFLRILPEELFLTASRLASVLGGFIGLVTIYKFALAIFVSRRSALLAGLFFIICPFILFNDRLAEYDSLLSSMILASVYFAYQAALTSSLRDSFLWGVFQGLAFLTKATASLFWFLTPIMVFLLIPLKKTISQPKKTIIPIALALIVGQILNNSIIVSSGYEFYVSNSLKYTPSIDELIQSPFALLGQNLALSIYWLTSYLTPPFFLVSLLGFVLMLRTRPRLAIFLSLPIFAVLLTFGFLARIFVPRYLNFLSPFFLLFIVFVFELLSKKLGNRKLTLVLPLIALMSLPLRFDFLLLTDPPSLSSASKENLHIYNRFANFREFLDYTFVKSLKPSLPVNDDIQYISGFASGYGYEPIYQYVNGQLKKHKITLVIQGSYSHPPNAFHLHYWGNENIRILERWPLTEIDEEIESATKDSRVYFLISQVDQEGGLNMLKAFPYKIVASGKKPGNRNPVYLLQYH